MGPIVTQVKSSYVDKSVKFVTFDFTSDETIAAAEQMAESLGVVGTYAEYAGKTGFALLYDTKSQKIVTKFSARDDAAAWEAAIDQALDGA